VDYFREELSKYLNNTQNPAVKLEEIRNSINYIFNLIENENYTFPVITDKFKELLTNNSLFNHNLFDKLVEKVTINGKLTKIGLNTLKVKTLYSEYDLSTLLEMLSSVYTQTYETIYQINKGCLGNAKIFKSLCYLINGVDINFYDNLLKFNDNSVCFPFIFRQNKYEFDREDIEYISSFLMVYSHLLLFSLYKNTSHFYLTLLNNIVDDPTRPEINESFENYLTDNTIVINRMTSFCIDNVLSLSGTVSNNVVVELNGIMETAILKLINLFQDFNISDQDVVSNITYDSVIQTYTWTSVKNSYSSFYEELPNILNMNKTFQDFVIEEENSKNETIKWFTQNISELKMLEYVAYQFSLNPVFFFNAYYIIHKKFSIDLVNRTSNNFDIQNWFNSFSYDPELHGTNLYNYLRTHQLEYDYNNIKLCSFVRLNIVINDFCSSDLFKNWVINDILLQMRKKLSLQYLYHIDEYKFVDDICLYFKLIFIKDILDDVLFNSYISSISNHFNNPALINCKSSEVRVMNIETFNSFISQDTVSQILDNFFKATMVNKYLNKIFDDNYSLISEEKK